jgi:competence protein ComEC
MLLGYYGGFAVLLLWPLRRGRLVALGACLTVCIAALSWQYLGTRTRQLRVTFLDVGSGDAIVVQSPHHHTLLIDGGGTHDGHFDIGRQVIAPFLWDRYIRRVDLMALTHPEANHARGLVSVLQLFPTLHLLTNGTPLTAPYLADLRTADRRWGTQAHTALDGQREWQWERLRLTVLAPPSREEQRQIAWQPPTENDRSLVLRLQYGAVRLLFTGDIQRFTERWLLAHRRDLRADILQIPHHGSKTSTLPAFVQHVRPQVAVISLGAGNTYGHPHPHVLGVLSTQGVPVFRTDQHGAITISSDGTRFQVVPFRPYRPALTATGTSPP